MLVDIPDRCLEGHVEGYALSSIGSNGRVSLYPRETKAHIPTRHPVIQTIGRTFDIANFGIERAPILIGEIPDMDKFSRPGGFSVTDMPLKFPGTDYRLPMQLSQFEGVIQQCIDYEYTINPALDDYYVYLTIDQKQLVAGRGHRGTGIHSDGLQGPRWPTKMPAERTYLVTNTPAPVATKYYNQAFDMSGCDVDKHNLTALFRAQADPAKSAYIPFRAIAMFDCYLTHEGPTSGTDSPRTLFKLLVSKRHFDRLGNTHNALFDYDWDLGARPLPDLLPPPSIDEI